MVDVVVDDVRTNGDATGKRTTGDDAVGGGPPGRGVTTAPRTGREGAPEEVLGEGGSPSGNRLRATTSTTIDGGASDKSTSPSVWRRASSPISSTMPVRNPITVVAHPSGHPARSPEGTGGY